MDLQKRLEKVNQNLRGGNHSLLQNQLPSEYMDCKIDFSELIMHIEMYNHNQSTLQPLLSPS